MMTFQSAAAVTPHDTNPNQFEALFVGGAGDVVIVPRGSSTAITFTVPAGSYIWMATSLVKAATDATNIIGFNGG